MRVLLFEDALVSQLDPVAIGKPAFAISCGGYRLLDVLDELELPIVAAVRPHLQQLVAADYPQLCSADVAVGSLLVVNARIAPAITVCDTLKLLVASGRRAVVRDERGVVLAALIHESPAKLMSAATSIQSAIDQQNLESFAAELPLFEYPHDILKLHRRILPANLNHRLTKGGYEEVADGVFLADTASLGKYVTTQASAGPIILEAGVTVGPYSYLSGPMHLGPGTRVLEHASLKDGVVAGHTVKIGGEVEASIIEPYTNKQHHGFLGHSYLGSWINLGAGTCNSDLKNTYGNVNMLYRGQKVNSGMQFVGAIIGDYAKTAINTGIFTGKTIGVCSMVYGFVTTNVPSYVNYARLFGQVTEAPVEVMVSTQRRMFARRGVEQRPCDIQLLHDMHAQTLHERQALGESLSIEPLSL